METVMTRIKEFIVRHTTYETRWTFKCLLEKHSFEFLAVLALFAGPLVLFLDKLT